jgi:PAS domain S-box-containing protein
MTEILSKITTSFLCEGVCAFISGLALAIFLRRVLRRRALGDVLLCVAWLGLTVSFFLSWLSLLLGPEFHRYLDPAASWHVPVRDALRYYVGVPLLFLGGAVSGRWFGGSLGGGLFRGKTIKRSTATAAGRVTGLQDNLAEANRDLRQTREEARKSATAADEVNNKLRETLNLLMSSEEKFRSTFERANDGFLIGDPEKKTIEEANPGMARLTGYDVQELAGMSMETVYGPEIAGYDLARFRKLAEQKNIPPITIKRRDGDTIRGEISFSIVHMGGRPMVLGIARDITERMRLMEQVEGKNLELEEANRELSARADEMKIMNQRLTDLQEVKDNFLSSVSHELRTPLTSIRSFSEILLEYREQADESVQREFLTIINKESERLTRLINDVLDLARIEAGEMGMVMKPVELSEIVADAVQSMNPQAEANAVKIEALLPSDLPPVEVDRDRVQQVVVNLVSNALRFAPRDSSVEVGARMDRRGMVEVAVRDHGPGISEQELETIFDRYKQGETPAEGKQSGCGLGLSICKEIITMHGGRIWGVSRLGRGSTFFFTVRVPGVPTSPEVVDLTPTRKKKPADALGELPPLRRAPAQKKQKPERKGLPPIGVRGPGND